MRWKSKLLKSHYYIVYVLQIKKIAFCDNDFIYSCACFGKFISLIVGGQIGQYFCNLKKRKNVLIFLKGNNFEVRGNLLKTMF